MQQNYGPPPHPAPWQPPPPLPGTPGGRGLAITAVVLSALALLGVVLVGGWVLVTTGPSGPDGSAGPLTGQLTSLPRGAPITGATLASAVRARITQDGGDVSRMDCPPTPRVAQGVVTVCHGVVSSSDYAIVVYFEDLDGHFTLEPI